MIVYNAILLQLSVIKLQWKKDVLLGQWRKGAKTTFSYVVNSKGSHYPTRGSHKHAHINT